MAEPTDLPFVLWTMVGRVKHKFNRIYQVAPIGLALPDKYRTQKIAKDVPSGHHHTTLSGCVFATKARIDNRKKKLVKHQYLLHMSPQYGELRPTNG